MTRSRIARVSGLARVTVLTGMIAALAACGRPAPPDLRAEMTGAVLRLGVRPIYPLSESHRIGAVHLVDAAVARPDGGLPSWQEGSLLLTEELVNSFEARRQARPSALARFPQSPGTLGTALRPATTGQAFFRQVPAASADAPPRNALSLAGIPGFTLASVDQASGGGVLPGVTASFFAGLGLRHTSYLRMEAEGIERADLPLDDLRELVFTACSGSAARSIFGGQGAGATGLVQSGMQILEQLRGERGAGGPAVQPHLTLMRSIFYLRGIRFVVEDSRVAAAFMQLARQSGLRPGETVVSLAALRANVDAAPAPVAGAPAPSPGGAQANAAAQAAAIAALQGQIEQLRSALASSAGPQLGASFARASATGVELVQLFDRPLAFGYQAFFVDARKDPARPASVSNLDGFGPICRAI